MGNDYLELFTGRSGSFNELLLRFPSSWVVRLYDTIPGQRAVLIEEPDTKRRITIWQPTSKPKEIRERIDDCRRQAGFPRSEHVLHWYIVDVPRPRARNALKALIAHDATWVANAAWFKPGVRFLDLLKRAPKWDWFDVDETRALLRKAKPRKPKKTRGARGR